MAEWNSNWWVLGRMDLELSYEFMAEWTSNCALGSWQGGPQIVLWVLGRVDLKLCSGSLAEWTSNCVLGFWQRGLQFKQGPVEVTTHTGDSLALGSVGQ